jgi:predicted phage tail protein
VTAESVTGIMNLSSHAGHGAVSFFTSPGNSRNISDTPKDSLALDLQRRNLEIMKERVKSLQKNLHLKEKKLSEHMNEANDSKDCVKECEHQLKIEKIKEYAITGALVISGLTGTAAGLTAYAASSVITSPIFLGAGLALAACVGAASLILGYFNNAPYKIEICEKGIEYHTRNIQSNKSAAQVIEWQLPSLQDSLKNAKEKQATQELEILKDTLNREKSGDSSVSDDDEFIMIGDVKLKKSPRKD